LRLGQPATELSGGEAQRIRLASELQRIQKGGTLYVQDEPTTGLHPADVEKLILQLDRLAMTGNTVVTIEHEMQVAAISDWVIDIGPGPGRQAGGEWRLGGRGPSPSTKGARLRPICRSFSLFRGNAGYPLRA
jgi:excinuclease ABC subunit A